MAPIASPVASTAEASPAAAGDELFGAPDPFATPEAPPPAAPGAGGGAPPWFDPDAVRTRGPSGLVFGPLTLHGRANVTGSYSRGLEPVELLDHAELELSSADLYAELAPLPWLALLGEVEVTSDLEADERELEVEPELLVVELRPLSDERLRLRAGLFPVPFGLERRHYAPPRNELVTRPAPFRALFPGTWSDLGVVAWGRLPLPLAGGELEAEVGLVRGLEGPGRRGDRQELERDENHEPMLAGRVGWTLVDLRPEDGAPLRVQLTLGASVVAGHWDDDATRRLRFEGWDVSMKIGPLSARAELVRAAVEADDELDPAARGRRARGLYVLACWRHEFADAPGLEALWLAGRWDVVDDDRRVRDAGDLERWHLGLGWVPLEGLTVKLEGSRARWLDERVWTALLEVGYAF